MQKIWWVNHTISSTFTKAVFICAGAENYVFPWPLEPRVSGVGVSQEAGVKVAQVRGGVHVEDRGGHKIGRGPQAQARPGE